MVKLGNGTRGRSEKLGRWVRVNARVLGPRRVLIYLSYLGDHQAAGETL